MAALVIPYGDASPRLGQDVFLAPTATVVGDVELGDGSSVWFGSVLRGDVAAIRVGRRTNIQDLSCLHVTGGLSDLAVGDDVTVGHRVVLHGCSVGHRALIGIGAVVLDQAQIGDEAVVAAGALVPPGMVVPARSLARGVPARVVGPVTAEQRRLGAEGAEHYLEVVARYRDTLAAGSVADRPAKGR